ncbi:methyltransferase [Pseudonocardia alaniniphila]
MQEETDVPRDRLELLADGYLATQLLYVGVDLKLAERLADGPRTAESLATEIGVDAGKLRRVMRGLASFGVFDEPGDGSFGLTATGTLLREGVPGSARAKIFARGELYYGAFGKLREGVRGERSAFELVHGTDVWDYLTARPELTTAFQAHMTDRSTREAAAVVASYDFGRLSTLVDVGGGRGVLLAALLATNPGLSGVLFDRPDVVADALPSLPEGTGIVGGDFFAEVPAGADVYVMSKVIHDWGDEEATRILGTVRRAMRPDSTLLLVESVLPARAVECPATVRLDLLMLAMVTGRERTEAEFAELLVTARLRLQRAIAIDDSLGQHILEAVPA